MIPVRGWTVGYFLLDSCMNDRFPNRDGPQWLDNASSTRRQQWLQSVAEARASQFVDRSWGPVAGGEEMI